MQASGDVSKWMKLQTQLILVKPMQSVFLGAVINCGLPSLSTGGNTLMRECGFNRI
jgi:hypothetical protein